MRKTILILAIVIPVFCLLGVIIYNLPPVYDRLAWRVEALKAEIRYGLNPPQQVVFVPSGSTQDVSTPTLIKPTATPTIILATDQPTPTMTPMPTGTLTPTPLPAETVLDGIRHEYQTWNNCGPANLAMALSFWGWQGTQRDTAPILKPNDRDKNVMPYEMEAFVDDQTELLAVVRVGGDMQILKAFIASGFPVIVEKGFEGPNFDGWMGHYQVVSGFDDSQQVFFVQDSYKGANLKIAYPDFEEQWRAFNYTYIVIYPGERRDQVVQILGLQAFDNFNNRFAEQKARAETASLSGRAQYFAWNNLGTNLVALQDYAGAATAYDAAFANYPNLPEAERPWRMLWYQTGPYFAYYYTGRYQDVIDLATTTLDTMSESILEESFYWRARARLALGDREGAIEDLRTSLEAHPDFAPALEQLALLGEQP
ncbi:MAG TPA: C39 family peptidase [Anaerolineales bacterium]|nr:C39 family peptidase [Anaerolineales bacterium]